MPAPTIPMGWSPEHRSSMSPVKHVIGADCPPNLGVLSSHSIARAVDGIRLHAVSRNTLTCLLC
jgi:hypothetical protein